MFRKQLIAVTLLIKAITCADLMAQPADWVTDVEEGIGKAKGLGVLVLFYLDTAEKDAAGYACGPGDGSVSQVPDERVRRRPEANLGG